MPAYFDRVKDTTTTTGTGTITVSGTPPSGYAAFSTITTGTKIGYAIVLGAEWEVGEGTLASATTISRDTVLASSNSGALVNFSAGTKDVWVDFPARQAGRSNLGRSAALSSATL